MKQSSVFQIVTKNTNFEPGLIATSSLGFGGANAHLILKADTTRENEIKIRPRHRVILASGRTTDAVNYYLDGVHKNEHDHEFLALVNEIHKSNISGHNYRGYVHHFLLIH